MSNHSTGPDAGDMAAKSQTEFLGGGEEEIPHWLDRLDALPPWKFMAVLYVSRWVLLLPYMILFALLFSGAEQDAWDGWSRTNLFVLLIGFIVAAPLLETLIACTLPYVLLAWMVPTKIRHVNRLWLFVALSTAVMVVLHPIYALIPTAITGSFLAYCYAHFSSRSQWAALGFTSLFHAGINIVGWTLIAVGRVL